MYSTLISIALFSALAIQGALADFTVNTPQEITTCGSIHLKWDAVDNAKSYNVALVSSADPCNTIIADLGDHTGTSMTWNSTGLKVGDSLLVSVLADDTDEGWSSAVKVTECAKTTTTSTPAAEQTHGTTLVVNPAAGPSSVSSAPAAPSDTGAQAVGAANSGVLGGSNGALSVRFSASTLALSAVAAVAALAF